MSLDHDKLKQRRAGNRGGMGWKPKDGENRLRILPPASKFLGAWDQLSDVAVSYKMHYFRIEGRQTEVSRCLEEIKQRCPACEAWRSHRKSTDPGLKELAKQVAPADSYLMNVLDINNLQAGIQHWGANYTCWDKILEIVANPAWGNVLDPENGVNFVVNMTPGNKSRTGYNQYSVLPEPQRTTVQAVLEQDSAWREKLDALGDQITAAKDAVEIQALLDEMGFPPPPSRGGGHVAPAAVASAAVLPVAGAVKLPAVAPVAIAVPRVQPPAVTMALPEVHYDPGPTYAPKTTDQERPAGAPRCFGDYNPTVHRCRPCPVQVDCQMRMLKLPAGS